MASVLPDANELGRLTTLADLVAWAGLADPAWVAISGTLGTVPDFRVLGLVPGASLQRSLRAAQVPLASGGQRELSVVEAVQVGLVWRLARAKLGLTDEDPLVTTPAPPAA
eukprot:6482210-Amphidinium_carterae.1